MNSSTYTILMVVITILSLIAGFLGSRGINTNKRDRASQFIMPIAALAFCLVLMPYLEKLTDLAMALLRMLGALVEMLGNLAFLPLALQNVLNNFGGYLEGIALADRPMTSFIYLNLLILSMYLIYKLILIKVVVRIFRTNALAAERAKSLCYVYSLEEGGWFLKENMVQTRSMFKALFIFSVIFASILLAVSTYLFHMNITTMMFYPVFCVILVSELYFYLDGRRLPEKLRDITGEGDEAERKANYALLRTQLKRLFGDKLMAEDVEATYTVADDTTLEDVIHQFETDTDPVINNLGEYIKTIRQSKDLDTNYLYSMRDLLSGKSILFNNPFYRDLIPYIFYPMNRRLLAHKKVLVILGRHAVDEEIKEWLADGIGSVTNMPYLWKIDMLGREAKDVDIGIMTRSDVHNIEIHEANEEFLQGVDFVILLEPSKMISTAQIGMNLLVKKMLESEEDKKITYCLCDKNSDGLVDAMSHALMTSITEVSATRKHKGVCSYMCWDADQEYLHHRLLPNISRYLGVGTELSFAALKNGISKARWYGGEAFPVTDIRWIAKQYYHDLMNYAELPTNQDYMNEHFDTSADLWSAETDDYNYISVEDEYCNMFEMFRNFSTRATKQGFINVISSDYLLKDYMADNADIFKTDAKAIPNIVADYIRSDRNVTLRLLLMMSTYPVSERVVSNELSLLGVETFDLKKQLWYEIYKCFASVSEIASLSRDYREAVEQVSEKDVNGKYHTFSSRILEERVEYNFFKGYEERVYSITDREFLQSCVASLRSAAYVAEDEQGEKNYIGAELRDHVYCKCLPGQFFTFGGKYYEMQYLTADGQVLVRRAADHIDGRPSYRQIRRYIIEDRMPSEVIGASRDVEGIRISREYADFTVDTLGYYRMSKYHDFKTAKKVLFDEEQGVPKREYRNKEILIIDLSDQKEMSREVCYTVTLLLNEIFRTIFAENHNFISAITESDIKKNTHDNDPMTYSIEGKGCEEDSRRIYVIEDSQLDLGMINTVDRNLHRILGIVCDFLDWHESMISENGEVGEDEEPSRVVFSPGEPAGAGTGKKGILGFILRVIEKLKPKGRKKKDEPLVDAELVEDAGPTEDPAPTEEIVLTEEALEMDGADGIEPEAAELGDGEVGVEGEGAEIENAGEIGVEGEGAEIENAGEVGVEGEGAETENAGEVDVEGEGAETENAGEVGAGTEDTVSGEGVTDGAAEDKDEDSPVVHEVEYEDPKAKKASRLGAMQRPPYRDTHFLLYGGENMSEDIDVSGALTFLQDNGFANNALKQARDGRNKAKEIEQNYDPNKPGVRYCDFCGAELTGVEYETLKDGRDRCISCSRTAVKSVEEFQEIFDEVRQNMREFFGVNINTSIKVKMVNAKKISKKAGHTFVPTAGYDPRVIGLAIQDKEGFTLLVENGSPRMSTIMTMAHELTHIWQYINWNKKKIKRMYGPLELQIYEGMAMWAEIQYTYLLGEGAVAKRQELNTIFRPDAYGQGLLRFMAQYPLSEESNTCESTPFMNVEQPLDPAFCNGVPQVVPKE